MTMMLCVVLLMAAASVVQSTTCNFANNQTFDCSSIFDAHFYRTQLDPNGTTPAPPDLREHYRNKGIKLGLRMHPGRRTLKILLMTRNEWPLLVSWVIYHGTQFGFDNTYVLDSSSDPRCVHFLKEIQKVGTNVLFSAANLNTVEHEMNYIFNSLRFASDFLLKLDTDEFVAVKMPDGSPSISREKIFNVLDEAGVNGGLMRVWWQLPVQPSEPCHPGLDAARAFLRFHRPQEGMAKTLFPSATFEYLDLGAHTGRSEVGGSNMAIRTDLMVVHYHSQCYDRFIFNCRQACMRHGYIDRSDSKLFRIHKLQRCQAEGRCHISSHKVGHYLAHLLDARKHREQYYAERGPRADSINFTDIHNHVNHAKKFSALFKPGGRLSPCQRGFKLLRALRMTSAWYGCYTRGDFVPALRQEEPKPLPLTLAPSFVFVVLLYSVARFATALSAR